MASLAQLENIALPELKSMEEEDAEALRNWMFQVKEQLGYILTHIGPENCGEKLRRKLGE